MNVSDWAKFYCCSWLVKILMVSKTLIFGIFYGRIFIFKPCFNYSFRFIIHPTISSDLHTSNFGLTRVFIERELKLIFACYEMTGQIKLCIRKNLWWQHAYLYLLKTAKVITLLLIFFSFFSHFLILCVDLEYLRANKGKKASR